MLQVRVPRVIDADAASRLLGDIRGAVENPAHDAIVFTGGDGVFCDGLDMGSLAAVEPASDTVAAALEAFASCFALLRTSPKPTIALVDGTARGGGLGLAAACDVVVATDRSRFAFPELLWGMLPAIVYASVRERMTVQQCRLWMILGGARSAGDAHAAGLIDEVVQDGALDRAGRQWRRQLIRVRPETLSTLRAFLNDDVTAPDAAAFRGITLTAQALGDERIRSAFRRFAESGEPPWEGA